MTVKFCPQCGNKISKLVDSEGFCVSYDGYDRGGRFSGCKEHIVRFDTNTGEILTKTPITTSAISPWSILVKE